MSGEVADDMDGEDGSGGIPRDYKPDGDDGDDGGAAAMEEAPASIDEAKMEQLRRMMGGGDADSK